MKENEFIIDLLGRLDQKKTQKQVNADIKNIEKTVNMLRLTGIFAKGDTKKNLNTYIKALQSQLDHVKLTAKIDSKNLKSEVDKALNSVSFKDIDALNIDGNKAKLKVRKVMADAKAYVERNPISIGINYENRRRKLDNDLTSYLNKNTKIEESGVLLKEADKVRDLIGAINDKKSLKEAADAFQLYKSSVSSLGYNTKSTADKVKGMISHVTKLGSVLGLASLATNNFVQALKTLRSNDTILTEISKTSELTKKQLQELGDEAFKVAGKYGQLSSNFLLAAQEMARAGYDKNLKDMAELSTKVQGAGDMAAELSNQYIIATDKAFKMNGSIEELTATLDGANNITNNHALSMTDLAEAMSIVGSQAASSGMEVNEATAAVATMIAVTQRSGSEMANAFKGILMNLQQVTGEVDGEEIDTESLTKYEKACNELGVSLSTVKDGIVSLKEPMEIIRELSEAYTKLDKSDARRANLLSSVGGKYRANGLNALLENYDMYSTMLEQYADGLGSMDKEAEKTAKSWEGRMNSLSNSFTSFVNTLTDKEAVLNGISFFDRLIQGAESLVDTFDAIPVALTALNTSLVVMKKDYGITKVWDSENKKIDIEGNIFGIDISKIKSLKKHYEEAKGAILQWNDRLSSGKADLDSFNSSLVKNTTSLKEYLSTCSKDARGSIEGYRKYLKSTGQATEELRLKTILLNSALTFFGGIAVQAVVTGIATVIDKFNVTVTESKETVDGVNSKLSELRSQLEELNSLEYKSDYDRQKISQLEKELELQERILKVEQKRLYQNQVGTSFSDYFDKESLVAKQQEQYNRYNKEGYEYLSMRFELDKTSLEETEAELSSLQEKLENETLAGHDRFATEGKIAELTKKRNDLLEDQQKVEDQLTLNMGEYLKNYQTAREAAESGLLTGKDLEKAEYMAGFWNQMYLDSSEMVTNIQKMNGRYDNTNDLLEERFSNISHDDLVSLSEDDKRIALSFSPDNIIGFKELQEKIAETKGDIEEFNRTEISITPTISSSVQQLSGQLEPQFAKLGEAYQAIFADDDFSLDAVDNSMLEGLRKSFAEIGEETGVTFDPSALEPFFDTLTNKSSKIEDVQKAFNNLATAYFYSTDTLEQLNEETADAIEKQLEEMGVQNASEVVAEALTAKTEELAVAKEFLAQNGYELSAASADEANAFILEQIEAGNCSEALALLQLKKMLVNGTLLDTNTDINNVLSLARAAGVAVDSLGILVNLKAAYDTAMKSGNYGTAAVLNGQIAIYKAQIENEIANFNPVGVDFGRFGGGASSAKSAGKDAGKSYKDGLKEELSDLDSVISGVTGKIDDQISVIKTQKEAALESIDAQIDALEEQKSLLEEQKKALEEARDAAVDALEDERDARIEVIEQQKKQLEEQIKLIEKQIKDKEKVIDSIQDEIDAMKDANEQRKRQIDLQKAMYELERLQHQRTILQYSEEKGMHYVADTKGIRDQKDKVDDAKLEIEIANKEKQIQLIEKEIDLLNEKKDAISEQITLLDEEIDRINKFYDEEIEKTKEFYDSQIKAIDTQIEAIDRQIESVQKQREQTELYYETLIENLEKSKSKYEELTEILGQAELSAKLQQLGIDEEALLNGSEEEFEKLKNAYMDVVFKLNEGNAEVLSNLQKLSGYEGTAPAVLTDSNAKLDEMNGKLDQSNQSVGSVNSSLGETAVSTGEAASNVGAVSDSLNQMPDSQSIKDLSGAFDTLADSIGKVAGALGISGESPIGTITQALSNLNTATLGNESEGIIGQFALLKAAIMEVIDAIGLSGTESVNSLMQAVSGLNEIRLDENLISQFDNLKTAVEGVASAISGGGSSGSEKGGDPSTSSSPSMSSGADEGSKGGGGSNSITGAINEMGETAKKIIGGSGSENDGTVIGEFGSMKTAVNEVSSAIGTGESGDNEKENGSEGDTNLISSIKSMGDTAQGTLGEPDGDGVIGRFGQFKDVIGEAEGHVKGIYGGLTDIDGQEVECTIRIHVESDGFPPYASGTALGAVNPDSAEYKAKYTGNAHVSGTANVTGNWGVKTPGKSLVGELGQELWVHSKDGTFETVGDNGPEWINTEKGDLIFNHLQTKELLDKGNIVKTGTAYANGNIEYSDGTVIRTDGSVLRSLQPGDRMYDLQQKFEAYFKSIDGNLEKLVPNSLYEQNREMSKQADQISYVSSIVNNNRNVQQPIYQTFNITMPNVTDSTSAAELMNDLQSISRKKFQMNW